MGLVIAPSLKHSETSLREVNDRFSFFPPGWSGSRLETDRLEIEIVTKEHQVSLLQKPKLILELPGRKSGRL